VSFEEHIKLEHNMWNYLYFIVLVRVKNKTDYTGPESYVAQMIKVRAKLDLLESKPLCITDLHGHYFRILWAWRWDSCRYLLKVSRGVRHSWCQLLAVQILPSAH
jgi:hypothetical protein